MTGVQKCFTIWELAADCHELMIPQRITRSYSLPAPANIIGLAMQTADINTIAQISCNRPSPHKLPYWLPYLTNLYHRTKLLKSKAAFSDIASTFSARFFPAASAFHKCFTFNLRVIKIIIIIIIIIMTRRQLRSVATTLHDDREPVPSSTPV